MGSLIFLILYIVIFLGVIAGELQLNDSDPTINDEYCDDTLKGIDEPETSACSHLHTKFICKEIRQGQKTREVVPTSRVNDGFCDCCDGSDEQSSEIGSCSPNVCHPNVRSRIIPLAHPSFVMKSRQVVHQFPLVHRTRTKDNSKEKMEYTNLMATSTEMDKKESTPISSTSEFLLVVVVGFGLIVLVLTFWRRGRGCNQCTFCYHTVRSYTAYYMKHSVYCYCCAHCWNLCCLTCYVCLYPYVSRNSLRNTNTNDINNSSSIAADDTGIINHGLGTAHRRYVPRGERMDSRGREDALESELESQSRLIKSHAV